MYMNLEKLFLLFLVMWDEDKLNVHTDDVGNGAKYSGVMYLSPTAEIIALLLDVDKALRSVSSRLTEFLFCVFTLISEAISPLFSIWFLLSSSATLFCFLLVEEEVFWDVAVSSKIVMRKTLGFRKISLFQQTNILTWHKIIHFNFQELIKVRMLLNDVWVILRTIIHNINFTYLFSYGKSEGNWSCYVFPCYFLHWSHTLLTKQLR